MTINQENTLAFIDIEPPHLHKYSTIWLHGLGADGNDFVPIVPQLKDSAANMRFIFPHAPIIPVSLNHGAEMPAWFDIYTVTKDAKIDAAGIAKSVAGIEKLINKEIARGIPAHHIFLAGFSQGAAIALITGLSYTKPLAGILALSGFLPMAQEVLQNANPANRRIPIFMAHGTEDLLVPYSFGKATATLLEQAGYAVDWHEYHMAHSVSDPEVGDIQKWLAKVMG